MTDPRCTPEKRGLTAVEVVAATLLASLLMVAMLGVLRGLKAQEAALEVRRPIPSWQRTLDGVLEHDLANSRTFSLTPTSLTLNGFAGRDSGVATWQPAAITYQVLTDGERNWLVRQVGAHHELVLAAVRLIHVGRTTDEDDGLPPVTKSVQEAPITGGLVIEFWGTSQEEPVYGYRFHRP